MTAFAVQLLGCVWLFGCFYCCSVTKSCPALCDPRDCSTPGSSILHYLLECTQIHVPGVSDAISPSHPLFSPRFAFNLSQHQSLFHCVGSLHQVAKVLALQLQQLSFQWIFKVWFLLEWTGLISLLSKGLLKGLSRVFSSTTVGKYQFVSAQPSLWYNSHIHTWLLEKP